MLEQAVRVEAARLSLVKPVVETIKIYATKDLDDDYLDDLLERSRSRQVRTDYLEPFQERFPLSFTLMSEDRVSPSRSVGSVSPTNDLSLAPSLVEISLDEADINTCDVLFEEEIIPAPPREVARPPVPSFGSSDLLVIEDNLPEAVSAIEDVEMLLSTPSLIQVALDKAAINVCDVLFEEEIIPAEPKEVTRAPIPRFDSSDLLIQEDNFSEAVSAMEDVEMLSIYPCDITLELYKATETEIDVRECEDEILPETAGRVERPPVNWPEERSASPFVFDEYLLEPHGVETANLIPFNVECVEMEKASVVEDDIYFVEEEHFILEATVDLQQLMKIIEQEQEMFYSEERWVSPFLDENVDHTPSVEYLTLTPDDYVTEPLAYAQIHEADVYYYEEESMSVEAVVELQQFMKITEQEMLYSEERWDSSFMDENVDLKWIKTDVEYLTLTPNDYVTEPLACVQIHEADVYYYEEESMCMDVVCELTQIMKMTQSDLIISEERSISPVQDETIFMQPLSTDIELTCIEAVDHVESPLNQAKVDECDMYYYEEESFSVDVVCDVRQLLQLSTSSFSVEERVSSETVQSELSVAQASAQPSEIEPTDVAIAAKSRTSDTFVLPQVIVHRVEATSRLSPLKDDITATTSVDSSVLGTASVDECTIYTHDEESFSESTLEQTTTFERRLEAFKEQEASFDQGLQLQAQEEEIYAEETVEQKSSFESEARQRLEVPDDDIEMYSSGEEMFESWTVETYRLYVETRKVEADVTFTRSKQLAAAAVDTSHGRPMCLRLNRFLDQYLSVWLLCLTSVGKDIMK